MTYLPAIILLVMAEIDIQLDSPHYEYCFDDICYIEFLRSSDE